ncbi:hypothetical protein [Ectothiorhodospira sp. BSL-9]|uniref:hypothetical protein n=1 Tax=Ectothiorhodospira sp. BSL-9 TaxID=1442136 RepID=UPI0007B42A22|nr:hypothetical protein [Ectothiorhodospira sp. BSL-9]ANB02212.1 hypothetical protein ECTOBSL9_1549 [Ectothiorhodospira sp. BSL-9]
MTLDGLDFLVLALGDHIKPDGAIWDPVLNRRTPDNHYAHTSLGLALSVRGDPRWKLVLENWLKLDPASRGHHPFNRLNLLLLRSVALEADSPPEEAVVRLSRAIDACPLAKSYPSNNWALLAQLCRILESSSTSGSQRSLDEFFKLLDVWTSPSGAFIDFPRDPSVSAATPMAYHHKALFLASVASWHCDDSELVDRLTTLLLWSLRTWDGAGHAGGMGRSTHALFGDACLVASLLLLGLDEDAVGAQILEGIMVRLKSQRREDGLYWLNPGLGGGMTSWDGYMCLSVYNAWFAGIVSWASHLRATKALPGCLQSGPGAVSLVRHLSDLPANGQQSAAEFAKCTRDEFTALVSSSGQPPQGFSRTEVELRYAGGVPFHVRLGEQVVVPPPCRIAECAIKETPALAGWTPIFSHNDRLYGLDVFTNWQVEQNADGTVILLLSGSPSRLCQVSPEGLWGRVLAGLDWRVLGGRLSRQRVLRRPTLRSVKAVIEIRINPDDHQVVYTIKLDNTEAEVHYLNPLGHTHVASYPVKRLLEVGGSAVDPACLVSAELPSAIYQARASAMPLIRLPLGAFEGTLSLQWGNALT